MRIVYWLPWLVWYKVLKPFGRGFVRVFDSEVMRRIAVLLSLVLLAGFFYIVGEQYKTVRCNQQFAERSGAYQTKAREYADEDRAANRRFVNGLKNALVTIRDRATSPNPAEQLKTIEAINGAIDSADNYLTTLNNTDIQRSTNPAPEPPSTRCL